MESKTHRRSDFPASVPFHFFRIILQPDMQRQKLRLPPKFVTKFGKELSDVAILTVPTGRVWQVGLERVDKRIWFVKDWQAFAEYYSLRYGDFLEFRYEGNSNFRVLIFDMTCSEIAYPCQEQSSDLHSMGIHEEDMENDGVCDTLGTATPLFHASMKRKCKCLDKHVLERRHVLHPGSNLNKCIKRGVTSKENMLYQSDNETRRKKTRYVDEGDTINSSSVMKSAPASLKENRMPSSLELLTKQNDDKKVIQATRMFKPKNPFFSIILQPFNFTYCYLHVPTDFAEKYLSGCSESIKLQGSHGKQWDVRFESTNPSLPIICRGCFQFLTDNNLEEGDVCLFELMKSKADVVLKVSILRAAEYEDTIDSSNVKKSKRAKLNQNRMCGSQDFSTGQNKDDGMFAFDIFSHTYPKWKLKFPKETEKVTYATRMFNLKNPFFAVILQFNNFHLLIPVPFARRYLSSCAEFIKLQDSNGGQWDVQCSSTNASSSVLRFGRGYNVFLTDKNLEQGDVCLFELIKRNDVLLKVSVLRASEYEDMVHDKEKKLDEIKSRSYRNGHEEEIPELVGRLNEKGKSPSHKLSAEDEGNTEFCNSGTLYYSSKIEKTVMSKESRRAFNAAKKFKTENPAFLVFLRHYHKSFLVVPAEFDTKHLGYECPIFITLEAPNGKRCHVRCIYATDRKKISGGWSAFSSENNLEEGDVCVFELTASKDVVLKASIFRAAEFAD
ncbi:putative transcription factor B3-Domain family [Rosa chinensis]|uniref:Putative transcription factor B3-Domain family n=2 Tax=Rosa chinensis TaxID=74649 RepID=A0A2P6SE53_ROSCH|nr:putative transcription factor B3-Domain family [Rosa chinensis]